MGGQPGLFQAREAMTENARSPNVDCCAGEKISVIERVARTRWHIALHRLCAHPAVYSGCRDHLGRNYRRRSPIEVHKSGDL